MEKKRIRIAFTDFNIDFDSEHNFIVDCLKKHYDVQLINESGDRQDVQYLFYSYFGKKHLEYKCVRIFVTGENFCPDFNLCDYALGFEYLSFEDRYIRYPLYLWDIYRNDYELASGSRDLVIGKAPEKRKFCSVVVSNNYYVEPSREEVFHVLSEYRKVDSGGRAFNNIGKPDGIEDKQSFISEYKFNIAFENSIYSGYSTEKIMQAFAAGTVPIYRGDLRVEEVFNKEAFVNCNHLTMEQILETVKDLDRDDTAYLKMLMAPAFVQTGLAERLDKELEEWLCHIMDQPYENAWRRAKYGKMQAYEDNQRKRDKLEKMIKGHPQIYRLARKLYKG